MTLKFTYCPKFELFRIVQAVIIDSRVALGYVGKNGNELQPLIDAEVAKVIDDVVFYKIENINNCGLVGYFTLQVGLDNTVRKYQQVIRPAFQSNLSEINNSINQFVQSGDWQQDFLF